MKESDITNFMSKAKSKQYILPELFLLFAKQNEALHWKFLSAWEMNHSRSVKCKNVARVIANLILLPRKLLGENWKPYVYTISYFMRSCAVASQLKIENIKISNDIVFFSISVGRILKVVIIWHTLFEISDSKIASETIEMIRIRRLFWNRCPSNE